MNPVLSAAGSEHSHDSADRINRLPSPTTVSTNVPTSHATDAAATITAPTPFVTVSTAAVAANNAPPSPSAAAAPSTKDSAPNATDVATYAFPQLSELLMSPPLLLGLLPLHSYH